jgi:hypothetical protein
LGPLATGDGVQAGVVYVCVVVHPRTVPDQECVI